MRIGVDSRPLRERQISGIPNYVRSVIRELERIDTENEYVLYAHKDFRSIFHFRTSAWRKHVGRVDADTGLCGCRRSCRLWLKRDRIDIFWGTQHSLPLLMPKSIKAVLTGARSRSSGVSPRPCGLTNRLINRVIIPSSVHRADAHRLHQKRQMDGERRPPLSEAREQNHGEVTYLGYGDQFFPRDPETSTRRRIAEQFGLPARYLFDGGDLRASKEFARRDSRFRARRRQNPSSLGGGGDSAAGKTRMLRTKF